MKSKKTILTIIWIALFLMSPNAGAKEEDAFDKGLKLIGQHRYDEAIQAFSTAIEIIPQDYQAYNYRGVAWALKGNYDKALADYNKALEIRPRYAEAYNNRGFARTQSGDLRNALNDYSRALKINPFFVDAYNNKAWVLATCADPRFRDGSQAVRLAQKAVELKPDITSLDTLAAAYAAAGNFDAAVDTQKKAIQKLLLADRNSEVPKYLPHLNAYKSGRSLRINYASKAKAEAPESKSAKVSLKKQTAKPAPSTTSQKVVTASKSKAQKRAASPITRKPAADESKPSSALKAQKTMTASKAQKPAAVPKTKKLAADASKPSSTVTAQKVTTASKNQKSAAAPKTKKTEAAASKPAATVTAKKTASASTTQKPAAEPQKKKPLTPEIKPLPYTIQVSAYRDPQTSNRVAGRLITAGDPAFTSPVDLSEKGKWYRVYIGNYNTLKEAKIAAAGLKNRNFRYVHIAKKPYTVQVGLPVSKSGAQQLKSKLKAKGYLAYSLPAVSAHNQTRVLIGAFESRAAAANLVEQLKKDGFDPKIGMR